ncbi:GAF and ANTAR domain-containing protein [Conyzicola nivalis]|uniref:Transcriptional regulator n=1 Tax=Conyzicola nivalis TaxID=1477021 RepID=A0A916SG74_9MICO|nr:GAF and ANTAR domain-containing protein [Conyzicola nivalis]GGA94760.1 transcriptional regulator [Conyzicola nivalis]
MASDTRERRLTTAFVTLADTLVAGYDVVDLLQTLVDTCADLLDASAAGIMLADSTGELAVVASTSEKSRIVETIQLSSGAGPCVECFASGSVVTVSDVSELDERWPEFSKAALEQGFRSVHGVPLRLRGRMIGTLNLFRPTTGALSDEDKSVAQGLADVATIGILQERAIREADIAKNQLQHALDSRVLIEQAKGVIAYMRDVDMDAAFQTLRAYARGNNLNLRDVAERVVNRSLSL